MLRRLFNTFLDEAQEATALTQLGRAFVGLAAALGYQRVVVFDTSDLSQPIGKALLFTAQGRAELGHIAGRRDAHVHPAVAEALAQDRPILADDIRRREGISQEEWAKALPPEVATGQTLILPVHRQGRCVLIAGCSGQEASTTPVTRSLLHTAAHVVYDRHKALKAAPAQHPALTQREAECLHWMGQGKTGSEIAKITGISARTVRYHLRNVKKKLGAQTTIDALRKLSSTARA